MKNIALVYLTEISTYDYDGYSTSQLLATSIVDWTEVSDEDFHLLVQYSTRTRKFVVVERPSHEDENQLIVRAVADQVAFIKKEERKREAAKAAADREARERAAKKAATSLQRKQKQLDKLRRELEQAGVSTSDK